MIRGAGRVAAAATIAALTGAAWLALIYGRAPGFTLEFDVTPPPSVVRGVYTAERDDASGRTFAWTADRATIRLDDLDRQVGWTLDIAVRGARAGGAPNPELQVFADGVLLDTIATAVDFADFRVEIPPQPAANRLTVELRSSSIFVPGPGDKRSLGVMLDRVVLTPAGIALPPRAAFAGVAIAAAAAAAGIAAMGVTAGSAVGAAILLSGAIAALVARGFGPYTDFAAVAARASVWIVLVGGALVAAATMIRGAQYRQTAKFAIGFSGAALLLKLLVLLHPNMPIGDALFHAHRFHEVLDGRWYFTSIAPGNYQFPYAPGLYVFAIPFAGLVRRGAADMTVLRTIVCVADVLAGLLLYSLAARIRGDRLSGAVAVALYQLIPLGFGVITVGNLTNAFAQAFAIAGLALMASPGLRVERRAIVAALVLTLAVSFMSHTSAFAIGAVGGCVIAAAFWWRGGPALRSPALAVLAATVVAAVVAIGLYYAHFLETYRTELTRISAETATAAPDAGGRGIVERAASVPRYLRIYFGIPVMLLGLLGGWRLWQRGARDRGTLTVAGWATTCVLFLVLGILTPVDMRHYFAAVPVVAVAAAIGVGIERQEGRTVTAAALLALAAAGGINAWWSTLG
jgi:hypothetical protein